MIRVGRCKYDRSGKRTDPTFDDFTNIIVLMKSHSKWGALGPYLLKDERGRIFENIWQFAKVYKVVPAAREKLSRYSNTVIWEHPEETHVKNDKLTEKYFAWRKKGMNAEYAIRYPVGFHHRHKCLYSYYNRKKLSYIQARYRIYLPLYVKFVKKEPKFDELKKRLNDGENLLIIEVDGPHQESLDYYKEKYDVDDDFIVNDTMLIDEDNINIMMNDPKHPFGHGYCLAYALLSD